MGTTNKEGLCLQTTTQGLCRILLIKLGIHGRLTTLLVVLQYLYSGGNPFVTMETFLLASISDIVYGYQWPIYGS